MIRRILTMVVLLALLSSWLNDYSVQAHNYNNGYSYLHIAGDQVKYEQLLPFPVMLAYDTNGNQVLEEEEVASHRAAIESYVLDHLTLFNNEQRMDAKVEEVKKIIQEQTEDPMVRVLLTFSSPMPIGNLTIMYNLIFSDVDEAHQNYIVLFDDQENMLEHWVVDKSSGAARYTPDSRFRFDLPLIGKYALLGVQKMLFSVYCWLLLLVLLAAAPTLKETAVSVGFTTLYTLLGLILTDKLAAHPYASWLHPVALVALAVYGLYTLIVRRHVYPRVVATLFGLAWGSGSVSLIQSLQLNNQFKVVSLLCYYVGVGAAWLVLLFILHTLLSPVLHKLRSLPMWNKAQR